MTQAHATPGTVRLSFSSSDVTCFAMEQAGIPLLRDLVITNDGAEPLTAAHVALTLLPDLGSEQRLPIQDVPPGGLAEVRAPDMRLTPGKLRGVLERETVTLRARVYAGDRCVAEESRSIDLLAFNEWPGARAPLALLASFVTPNQKALLPLLDDAKGRLRAAGSDAIDGYQSRSRQRALAYVRTAFEAVQGLGASYLPVPASFERTGQKVRLVDTVLSERGATCLDATLLLASLLEAMGLRPIIVLLQGHAFLAVWLIEDRFPEGVVEDAARLRTLIELGNIVAFETTIALGSDNRSRPFDHAVAAARQRLADDQRFLAALDVAALRDDGIRPLSFRELSAGVIDTPGEYDSLDLDAARRSLDRVSKEEPPSRESLGPRPSVSPAAKRFQVWKDRLLDLSLRNRLLNFRLDARAALALDVPDAAKFEDLLAGNRSFELTPRTPLSKDDQRDPELVAARTAPAAIQERRLRDLAAGVLHSPLAPDDFWNRAVFLDRIARTDLEDGGACTLYAAIGLLRWFETADSEEPRLAPLLLYAVTLGFDRQRRRVRLLRLEEDPLPNQTLIEKMRRDHDVDLASLATLEPDESGVDVPKLLSAARHAIQQKPRWEVLDQVHVGHFKFTKFLMWKDLNDNAATLLENPVVQHIAVHDGAAAFDSPGPMDPAMLDDSLSPADLPCVVDADSTQMLAIHRALTGSGLVLQGPPGTGKSQTITNLIAAALARGQTVLFVAEKMAALEVVHRRLRDVGLDDFCLELHSHKTTRKQVAESFGRSLRAPNNVPRASRWAEASTELSTLRGRLNTYVRDLHAETPLGRSLYEVSGRLLELATAPQLAIAPPDVTRLTSAEFSSQRAAVESFATSARPVTPCRQNPWRWSTQGEWTHALEHDLAETLGTLPERLHEVERAVQDLAATLGADSSAPTATLLALVHQSGAIERELKTLTSEIDSGPIPMAALGSGDWAALAARVQGYTSRRRALARIESDLGTRWSESLFQEDLRTLHALFARWATAFFLVAWFCLWGARRRLRHLARGRLPSNEQIRSDIELAQQRPVEREHVRNLEHQLGTDLADVWTTTASDPDALDSAAARGSRAHAVWRRLQELPQGRNVVGPDSGTWRHTAERLGRQRERLATALTALEEAEDRLVRLTKPAQQPWPQRNAVDHRTGLLAFLESIGPRLNSFRSWCQYQQQAAALRAAGLDALASAHLADTITTDQVLSTWERSLLEQWRNARTDESPALRDFDGARHDDTVAAFRERDRAHVKLARDWIANRLRERVPRADGAIRGSELHLLRRETEKKGRHLAVRKLLQALPELRPRLKPCLLMSPLSVAQFLPPRSDFDLVVFDEASQIETHDAIGAIARGKKVVIVGDSQQLPPTRFFARTIDDDDAPKDENDVVDLDSILDEARAKNLPECTLGWHYRSRHDALIEFSNNHYYERRLQVFPAARRRVPDLGLAWHSVSDGMYYSGSSKVSPRTNPNEARALVAQLMDSLQRYAPGERTFGVVTFSLTQKELIDSLLDECREAHPAIEAHFSGPEGVFVKNLENVQGDERDEILFSVAYAKNENGTLRQHFGPLSNAGGERRLNVAVTRARRQLRVFSTITHDQIDLGRTRSRGAEHLRQFLRFAAERGRAVEPPPPTQAFDSALETEVHRTLVDAGYSVRPKVGCGSYQLDLAIEHPQHPGTYALGIECDGPTYHLAKTARDRDRLRMEVLEGLAWRVHRVWSADWRFRREQVIGRLLQAAADACSTPPVEVHPKPIPEAPTPPVATNGPPPRPLVSPAAGRPYRQAPLAPAHTDSGAFYDLSASPQIRQRLHQLIQVEAPVHRDHAAKRVAACWGLSKLTQKAQVRCDEELNGLLHAGHVALAGDFLWGSRETILAYEGFRLRGPHGEVRDPDHIAPEEIANAMEFLIQSNGSIDEEALLRETGRLFGIERLGAKVSESMRGGLRVLRERGEYKVNGSATPVGSDAAAPSPSPSPGAAQLPPHGSSTPLTGPPNASLRYDLLEELGGGGMAECYRACDRESGQTVFFKRVRVGSAHAAALQREIEIYGRLQYSPCDHVLAVLDRERDGDYVALVTEFADGGDLRRYVESLAPARLALGEALFIATAVARGLTELHELDIVHRDLKPENILRSQGLWKLADFGIAKSRRNAAPGATFQQAGTYGYAAPEQFDGTDAHPSADVYSFGKLIVFLLTGHTDLDRLPVEYADVRRLAFRCASQTPDARPSIREVLAQLEQMTPTAG
jgi:very-short-patch-repair endonuclease